ncbi:hypothetical protein [uncultured Pseudoteredinibacter sp.]|uniref:hypothetical protein n=1 Tax=uncultured Pseudoteredinibacter sp. TaxID=1641701 RepID=UPI00261CA571|nr:hypothetical protein [uncultured Pseudoteredinibacter sp.]
MNNVKITKVMLYLSLTIFFSFLVSCESFHERTEVAGQFYEKTFYSTGAKYKVPDMLGRKFSREVCSKAQDKCWDGAKLSPVWRDPDLRYTEVNFGLTYFVDTKTGFEVNCKDCLNEKNKNAEWAFRVAGRSHWNSSATKVLITEVNKQTEKKEILLLEFNDGIGKKTKISPPAYTDYIEPKKVEFSPDGNGVAWLVCSPTCSLISYNITSATHKETPTPCVLKQHLSVKWVDGKAEPSHTAGAKNLRKEHLCTDAEGILLYGFNKDRYSPK